MTFQTYLNKSLEANHDRIAIEHGQKKLTYAELLARANAITGFLLEQNLEKETVIGISLRQRPDLVASMIGVANARCVFVLLDFLLPAQRLKSMIANLKPALIIQSEEMQPLAGVEENNVPVHVFEKIIAVANDAPLQYPECHEDDSLYIYFTSGSTGVPKGIIGKNSSLQQFIEWEVETFGINNESRFSQFVSPYFDAFLRDVFTPLSAGGTICIPPAGEEFFSPDKMIPWIDQSRIELIHCVPSIFRVFNDASLTGEHFKHLKYILLSAEKIIPSELTNWYNAFGTRIQLINLYGTTETTMVSSFHRVVPEDITKARIPIGYPIGKAKLLVSNQDFVPCQPLETGDLYIVSKYTTKGYLNNEELTKEKFIVINKGTPDETIAYKTGDKARVLANGEVELIGREDRQIKLRGIRIELDEVERILVQSEHVKNAVVIKHTEKNGDEALMAFFIAKESGNPELPNILQQHVENHLPKYMVPAGIFEVQEFPLLSNGKIDYMKLVNNINASKVVESTDEVEIKLIRIWKDIVGDKPIDTDASFHRMGGNSLSIMKLIGKIYKEFNVRISLGELFDNLTVQKQVAFIKRSSKDNLYVIPKIPQKPSYNVSAAQERTYFQYELDKTSTAHNLPVAWEVRKDFDKHRIEQAFRLLVERHEGLRTTFALDNGRLQQYIHPTVNFELEEITDVGDELLYETVTSFVRPFDLNNGPLFRCGVIYTRQGKKMLVADFHHIICDGMSQVNLFGDFIKFYNGGKLPPLPLQYKDYAEWEYNFKFTEEYITHREFWLRSFEGEIPTLDLPTVHTIGEAGKGGSVTFEIKYADIRPFLDFIGSEGITTFPGLLSFYYLFLSQLTGQEDIVIGVASAGRIQEEMEKVVGMFVKVLPIRYAAETDLSFADFVKSIKQFLIEATGKQVYDISNIVMEINKNRVSPVEQLYEASFAFLNFNDETPETAEQFAVYDFELTASKLPLTLIASEHPESFRFRMQYSAAHFTRSDMEMLVKQFQLLVENAARNMDAKIMELIGGGEVVTDLMEDDISFNI
jgi:mycobactin peptide synthetase MbtE